MLSVTEILRISDEIKSSLHHGGHELRQAVQSLATVSKRIQNAFEDLQGCNDRAELIDSDLDALTHQLHALTEEMDRVWSLRNNDNELVLEISKLKREIVALKQAIRREKEEHRAQLAESINSNKTLAQQIQSLERFNTLLKIRLNEMKEHYDTVIIDNVDLKDTVKSLKGTPIFNGVGGSAASGDPSNGSSTGPVPFGRTVVETNRGLTVTIESSPNNTPDKASLNDDWIPQVPTGAAFPFPDFEESTQIDMRSPFRPKASQIVKGTKEANESFERMKRFLAIPPLTDTTNTTNLDNNVAVASSSSASVTPSKVTSKLDPTVAAFTPSNSSSKDSAKSASVQASSPSKDDFKAPVTATNAEEGFLPPHLRRLPIAIKDKSGNTNEDLPVKDKLEAQDVVPTGAQQNPFTKGSEPYQATSLVPRVLPHLRRLTGVGQYENGSQYRVQPLNKGKNKLVDETASLSHESALAGKEKVQAVATPDAFVRPDPGLDAWLDSQEKAQSNNASSHDLVSINNDTLIEIDAEDSLTAGEKAAHVPPGFVPFSDNDGPAKTKTAGPIETNGNTSHTIMAPSEKPILANAKTSAEPTNPPSEEDVTAAFLAAYKQNLHSVSSKYAGNARKKSETQDDSVNPVKFAGAKSSYNPPAPTGTHSLGALLDEECQRLIMKPRKEAVKMEDAALEWKAVRKDGKVVYVL